MELLAKRRLMTPSDFFFAQQTIESRAQDILNKLNWHKELYDHALYALRGGKAVRPTLMFWIAKQWGHNSPTENLILAALSLEMIHAYSLIHDDLPCMDNDDFRRNRPTLHRLMGEAPALLLGDSLLTGAFEILSQCTLEAPDTLSLIKELSSASGAAQLVAGQLDDLKFEKNLNTSLETFHDIHRRKTGALFGAVCSMSYFAIKPSHVDKSQLNELRNWGIDLGIIFQYIDDLLDNGTLLQKLGREELLNKCHQLSDSLIQRSSQFWNSKESQSLLEYFLKRQL
ncbi:MAG: polyprenyl synthetase family protein [Proteobacteria bacterium]|nr:polyprenyl synthetase family protein [Pseudomonadota bacterium]